MEWFWLLAIYLHTKLRSAVEWLNGTWQLTINAILPQHVPKFIPRNSVICFFKIDKACKEIFVILARFLEDLFQSEDLVRGAATRTKTALTIFQFWFYYSSAFPFKAFGIYFPWHTEKWYASVVCTLLAISFVEYQNNHTCFANLLEFCKIPTQLDTLALTREFLLQSSLSTSQHLESDFIFTSSFSRFYPFNCRSHFCCSENFLFAWMCHFVYVTSRCLYRIQKIFKVCSPSWKDFILNC